MAAWLKISFFLKVFDTSEVIKCFMNSSTLAHKFYFAEISYYCRRGIRNKFFAAIQLADFSSISVL